MNVASLELSKELYELSGWIAGEFKRDNDGIYRLETVPRYSLSYLLGQLPPCGFNHKDRAVGLRLNRRLTENDWWVGYPGVFAVSADTPENAAAKLAIELFKQGVLEKHS